MSLQLNCTNTSGFLHPVVVCLIAALVLAHPDNLAVHVVRNHWLRSIAVRQDEEAVITVLRSILDGLLETGPATADSNHIPHHLLEALNHAHATIELYDINGLEAVTESTVDHPVEIAQTLAGDGSAYINSNKQLRVETADGSHILEPGPSVGLHARELPL